VGAETVLAMAMAATEAARVTMEGPLVAGLTAAELAVREARAVEAAMVATQVKAAEEKAPVGAATVAAVVTVLETAVEEKAAGLAATMATATGATVAAGPVAAARAPGMEEMMAGEVTEVGAEQVVPEAKVMVVVEVRVPERVTAGARRAVEGREEAGKVLRPAGMEEATEAMAGTEAARVEGELAAERG